MAMISAWLSIEPHHAWWGCMKQKHLHSTIGSAHAPNQHTQYVTLPFSYIELIVSGLYMLSREPGCARLYHTMIKRIMGKFLGNSGKNNR